jgi:membrane protein YdbS with pleckstrin-like domain
MKQQRYLDKPWQPGVPTWRKRLLKPLRWLVIASALAGIAVALYFASGLNLWWKLALGAIVPVLMLLLSLQSARRKRHSWRRDDSVFEPRLPSPISALYEEREWTLPSHPLIRYPMTLLLIGFMYWTLVLNQMNLPGQWLVLLVLLSLACLWAWREPLLLVLMVGTGVSMLAIIGWIVSLPPLFAAAAVLLIVIAAILGLRELRKRINKQRSIV